MTASRLRVELRRPPRDHSRRNHFIEQVLRCLGLYERGTRNALRPVLRHLSFSSSRLPASFDGFRILHLSDFHFAPGSKILDCAAGLISGIESELCVITGDYLWGYRSPCGHVFSYMEELAHLVRARHGIAAILGNHDSTVFAEPFRRMGIRMLINESMSIEKAGSRIWISGVDDPTFYDVADLEAALEGIPAEEYRILLAHGPDMAREASRQNVDLYLCGHTHWGQIRMPFLGALHYNSKMPRRISKGVWREGAMQGYTTAGLGTTEVPVRFCCPPEVVLIELRRV